ncbi:lonely Cys domain-containing protein, partial [Streptomyces sp. SID3212]|uniref:lonely Cys domain-containing protein n=1 Tax=Streptomyces sp. SID3212 TaxID=2690259 RepID=UPI0013686B0F
DTERDAFEAAADELRGLREAAERAAAEYHRVRAAADQLTRWHRLAATEEGVRQLDGLEEPPPVTYQAPPRPTPPARPDPPRYTRSGTGPGAVLTSPEQDTYTLHDGPRDGDSFFRALAEGLDRADPELLASVGIDLADPNAMPLLRRRLAARLTDPADTDLLAFVAPDDTDVFNDGEIGGAGLDLGADTPARREFDALGGLMPYAADLSPEVRAGLAEAQLLRKGDADDGTGWNHSAADLLPALAARTFGVRITVVGEDGGFQHFTPGGGAGGGNLRGLVEDADRDLPHVVLSLEDHHYQLAVPPAESTRSGTTTPPVPPPPKTDPAPPTSDPGPLTTDSGLSIPDPAPLTTDPGLSTTSPVPPPTDGALTTTDSVEPATAPALSTDRALSTGDPDRSVDTTATLPATLPASTTPPVPLPPPAPPVIDTPEVVVTPPAPTPPAQTPAPRPTTGRGDAPRGRAVRVPRNGECLLYSFMASDPERLRERLGLASVDRAAHDWLGNADTVHRDLRSHATTWRPRGPWNAVIKAVRGVVAEYVGRSDGVLHPQIAGQFRRTVTDAFAHRVARMDRAELLAHLAHHGVDHVSLPEAFGPDELLRLYVDTRLASEPAREGMSVDDARAVEEARAGSLAPSRMFTQVEEQGRLPRLESLTVGQLRRLLGAVYPLSDAPLDSEELARLLDAVENWESRWETPEGEIFLPLLAHVFDVQVDVVRPLRSGYRRLNGVAGPDGAVRHIEVYYNGSNHYEGSDAAPEVLPEEPGPGDLSADVEDGTGTDLPALDPREPVTTDELTRAGIELTGARQIHAALLGGAAPLSVADAGLSRVEQALLVRQRAADRDHRADATRAASSGRGTVPAFSEPSAPADETDADAVDDAVADSDAEDIGTYADSDDEVVIDTGHDIDGMSDSERYPTPANALLPPPSTEISFEERGKLLGDEDEERLTELARQVAWAGTLSAQARIPTPEKAVTVHITGLERAESVQAVFEEHLRRALRRLRQAHLFGGFGIVVDSRGRDGGPHGGPGRQKVTVEVGLPPYAAAVRQLATLVDFFEPEVLAVRILHRDEDDAVDEATLTELYELTADAMKAGHATSVDALAAYHLSRSGVFSAATRIAGPGGRSGGRNLTPDPITNVVTDTYVETRLGKVAGAPKPSPWHRPGEQGQPTPYAVVADGGHDHVRVPLNGVHLRISWREFAELLAMDPELAALGAEVPVLLLVPDAGGQGLDLPGRTAFRTGREVWTHTGRATHLVADDPADHEVRIEVPDLRPRRALGDWALSLPGDRDPAGLGGVDGSEGEGAREEPYDELYVEDVGLVADRRIKTVTLLHHHRPVGRVSMRDRDLATRDELHRRLPEMLTSGHLDPVTGGWSGDADPVPWAGRPVYYFHVHGRPMRAELEHVDGRVLSVRGGQVGGFVKRRPSFRKLRGEALKSGRRLAIVLPSCFADTLADPGFDLDEGTASPFVFDPLTMESMAQGAANGSGQPVLAPDRLHYLGIGVDGTYQHGIAATVQGVKGAWRELWPYPEDAELDQLAQWAGLPVGRGISPGRARRETLRLVRALRWTLGAPVEADKDDPSGEYRRLLRGIGALERMRRADPELVALGGPFSLPLLDRLTRAHLERTGAAKPPRVPVGPEDVKAMLYAAEAARTTRDDGTPLPLRAFVPLPSVDRAVALLKDQDLDGLVTLARGEVSWGAGAPDRVKLFWGTVKAREALGERTPDELRALEEKVLHLGPVKPGDGPRPAVDLTQGSALLRLAAGAAAVGLDPRDPAELAAYHLMQRGALSDSTLIVSAKPRGVRGRDWKGRPVREEIVTDTYLLSPDGSVANGVSGPAPWAPAPGSGQPASPYFVVADGSGGTLDLRLPTGTVPGVPDDEVAALVRYDQRLGAIPLATPVVLIGSDGGEPPVEVAVAIAGRSSTARKTLVGREATQLVLDPALGKAVIVVTGTPVPQRPDWFTFRPGPLRVPSPPSPTPLPAPALVPVPAPAPLTVPSADGEDGEDGEDREDGEETESPESARSPEFERAALDLDPGAFTRLLVAALDRDVPELLGAGPGSATPEALTAWLDSRLAGEAPDAEDRIPGTEALLPPYEMVTTGQLTALRIPLTLDTYAEASLQGDRLSVLSAGLTRTQQFRLLLAWLGADAPRAAAFVEALAALTAFELGIRLALLDAAGGRLLLGPPDGPVVSLDTARHSGTAGPM